MDYKKEITRITNFISTSALKLHRQGVILGLSGGIDSAVAACLAQKAFPRQSLALILPDRDSSPKKMLLAKKLAKKINLPFKTINITRLVGGFGAYSILPAKARKNLNEQIRLLKKATGRKILQGIAPEKRPEILKKISLFYMFKLRTRMILLYSWAFRKNFAVLGTTDKSEYMIGDYDRYGDGACDIHPIRHLYRKDLEKIALLLNIPEEIIRSAPDPDLISGLDPSAMCDMEDACLDKAFGLIEKGLSEKQAEAEGISRKDFKEIKSAFLTANERKKLPIAIG